MFIVADFGCFVSQGIGRMYAMPTATERPRDLPAHPSKVYTAVHSAGSAWHGVHGLTPISVSSRHSLQFMCPECNDLSQFKEDTGEPSIPV